MTNVLFLNVGKENRTLNYEIVSELVKCLNISKSYAVTIEQESGLDIFDETFFIWDVIEGKYKKDGVQYIDNPPLEKKDIESIAMYETRIMTLMGRMGNWSYEDRKRLYYVHLNFWINFIKKNRISIVLFSILPHHVYDNIIFRLCQIYQIKTVMPYPSITSLRGSYYWMKDYYKQNDKIAATYLALLDKYMDVPIDEICFVNDETEKKFASLCNIKENREPFEKKRWKDDVKRYYGFKVKDVYNALFHQEQIKWYDYWKNIIFFVLVVCYRGMNFLGAYIKTFIMFCYYEKEAIVPDLNSKFIYFPLHYRPECSSEPLGDVYENPLFVAKILSYNSPSEVKIYVKEHPVQSCYGRNRKLYRELKAVNKVQLIKKDFSSYDLMKKSMAVASLTGTAGWEAQFYGKPFMMFGHHLYKYAPGTICITGNEDCRKAIDHIINGYESPTLKELKIFLKSVEQCGQEREELTVEKAVKRIVEELSEQKERK